jgi:hypothetical protein
MSRLTLTSLKVGPKDVPTEVADQERVRDVIERVSSFEDTTPGQIAQSSDRLKTYYRLMIPGNYVIPTVTKGTTIGGCTGAVVPETADVTIQTDEVVTLRNLVINSTTTLGSTSRVIFEGCTFNGIVQMDNGATAHYIGCSFPESSVNNAGAAGNAYIIGCIRTSGVAHVNVTTIAETA